MKDRQGGIVFGRTGFLDAKIAVAREQPPLMLSPATTGGVSTPSMPVRMTSDIDGRCRQARAAGARIIGEPADHVFGDRASLAADLEGHVWNFGRPLTTDGQPPDGWEVSFPT